ncbi:MAG: DUF4160 domain-containing protein [Ignavibacteriales bacterium]|nr:DUF4160 domain-containing protein [Ignavibacteriales bacterium]
MPEISRFYGIVVKMFFREHNPPHFHVSYGDETAQISISDAKIINGTVPDRVLRLISEWVNLHRGELYENWELCIKNKAPASIKPLE